MFCRALQFPGQSNKTFSFKRKKNIFNGPWKAKNIYHVPRICGAGVQDHAFLLKKISFFPCICLVENVLFSRNVRICFKLDVTIFAYYFFLCIRIH